MKMLPRMGPPVEPAPKEICGPVAENGRVATGSVQIAVEREVLSVLLHQPGVSFAGHCGECGREAMPLTVETANVRFQQDSSGNVFVCLESMQSMERFSVVRSLVRQVQGSSPFDAEGCRRERRLQPSGRTTRSSIRYEVPKKRPLA